jgi:sulfur transfer protein SufE
MLETINAEKFCSGHSEIANRENVREHIKQMKNRQEKVRTLIEKGKNLEEIKSEFPKNEEGLIESVYNEIKSK